MKQKKSGFQQNLL